MNNSLPKARYAALLTQRRLHLENFINRTLESKPGFVLEIGCGHGHFLTAYAQAHPDKFCVGIDLVGERIERANRKRDRAELRNLTFVQTSARPFLETLPSDLPFSELFILFPDPWPKLRHRKHRLMQPDFLVLAAAHATKGCRLSFRTDFAQYFEETLSVLGSHPCWTIATEPWPFEYETVFQNRAPSFQSLIARKRP